LTIVLIITSAFTVMLLLLLSADFDLDVSVTKGHQSFLKV